MNITDVISQYILDMLSNADDGNARLRRNELAQELGCVPSQINYVITSRFTPQQGYIVESRRGGGGYISIRQVRPDNSAGAIMHTVNSIGGNLDPVAAGIILDNLVQMSALPAEVARVMAAAISGQFYRDVPAELRDSLRANQFRAMLAAWIS